VNKTHDLIIIGAGAAGLSAAQYGARANLKTLVLEGTAPGGQALLISDLENYPGFPEPVNGYDFAENMRKQAENFGAVLETASVSDLKKEDKLFIVETSEGIRSAPAVILATGALHRHLGVPGEEEFSGRGVSYCATCDGPFFKNKKILVVGGGDAACDEAMYLSKLSDKIVHIHRRGEFRAQKSLVQRVMDNPRIDVRLNTVIVEIRGEAKVGSVVLKKTDTGETWTEEMDAVFIFVGSDPQTRLAGLAVKDETGYLVTDQKMATNIPGLYAVGDVRATPFRQIVTACSDGATAAHCAAQYIDELGDI
jgi:thioredoxin reductase (NADPH)